MFEMFHHEEIYVTLYISISNKNVSGQKIVSYVLKTPELWIGTYCNIISFETKIFS